MPGLEWGASHPVLPLRPLAAGCRPLSVEPGERTALQRTSGPEVEANRVKSKGLNVPLT